MNARFPGLGIPVHARDYVPKGRVLYMDGALLVHPDTLAQMLEQAEDRVSRLSRLRALVESLLDSLAWKVITWRLKRGGRLPRA